jgi:hypothetical protein
MAVFIPLALLNEQFPAFTVRYKWPLIVLSIAAGVALWRFWKFVGSRMRQAS